MQRNYSMPTTRSKRKHDGNETQDADHSHAYDSAKGSSLFGNQIKRFKYTEKQDDGLSSNRTPATSPDVKTSARAALTPQSVNSKVKSQTPRTPSVSPAKKPKKSSKYAPPSKYAHLPVLTDVLTPNLICFFIGTNPGIRTATAGHAYAHPSNLFWKLLHSSGCTDSRLSPSQDVDLPRLYAMGNTNIVGRPTRDAAELSKAEMAAGTPALEEKAARFRPEAVCVVGKGIWEAIWRWRKGRQIRKEEFRYGWQDEGERMGKTDDWEGARVFVACSTSGISASLKPREKEEVWRPFGEWVKQRREERAKDGVANPIWEGASRVKEEDDKMRQDSP